MKQGLVQIYTGDGKGKTTAATGLMTRALGQGLKVLLARFLKPATPKSGEILLLQEHPNMTVFSSDVGVFHDRNSVEEIRAGVRTCFDAAREKIMTGEYDLAVFDEMNGVLFKEYLPLDEVLELIRTRPAGTELVFTGRNALPQMIEAADLVSRINPEKHPYDSGIVARKGIEF